jgi:plastocyanin
MRTLLVVSALLLTAALPTGAAEARVATKNVSITSFSFSPGKVKVTLGIQVRWSNDDAVAHTSTSNGGFWNTGRFSPGSTRTVRMTSAGTFKYHCKIHPEMHGSVRVKMAVSHVGSGASLRWATAANLTHRTFDVQVKKPGSSTWTTLRTNTTTATLSYHPSRAGSYALRARTDNTNTQTSSGWSPAVTITLG